MTIRNPNSRPGFASGTNPTNVLGERQAPVAGTNRAQNDSYSAGEFQQSQPRRTIASQSAGRVGHAGPRHHGMAAGGRAASEFERARRHSNRVWLLKWMLPLAGILAIVVIIASLFYSGSDLASVELGAIRIEKGKLVMDKPELNGTDSNKRPYHLTAARAVQDTEKPDRISLEAIEARLPLNDSQTATITAGTGLYDVGEKKLRLGGDIAVDTDDGMKIRMKDAQIDIGTGQMHTENPVEVDTGRANVKAETLIVQDNGKIIIFENRVRMTILPFSDQEIGAQPGLVQKPNLAGNDNLADGTE